MTKTTDDVENLKYSLPINIFFMILSGSLVQKSTFCKKGFLRKSITRSM